MGISPSVWISELILNRQNQTKTNAEDSTNEFQD